MDAVGPSVRSLLLAAGLGGLCGYAVAMLGWVTPLDPRPTSPAPHTIPKSPGGSALRLSMIDHVLADQFFRRGLAYYEARNEARQAQIAKLTEALPEGASPPLELLSAYDDLSAGYDHIGEYDRAAATMREKLRLLEAAGEAEFTPRPDGRLSERDLALYRTHANLGTHLIHAAIKAPGGPATRREDLEQGLAELRQAVAIHPEAHFGRETWQIVAVEYLLAALDDPQLLLEFDLIGNRRLGEGPPPGNTLVSEDYPATAAAVAPEQWRRLRSAESSEPAKLRSLLRGTITTVGAEEGWSVRVKSSQPRPTPFDESTLGILGMWMLGGGANPHFALTLAGTMERVGEYEIAWRAYERASQLQDKFSPRPEVREAIARHCQHRQSWLLSQLAAQHGGSTDDLGERLMRNLLDAQAAGTAYQAARNQFERDVLANGGDVDDPELMAPFRKKHPLPGGDPTLDRIPDPQAARTNAWLNRLLVAIAGAGFACLALVLITRWRGSAAWSPAENETAQPS